MSRGRVPGSSAPRMGLVRRTGGGFPGRVSAARVAREIGAALVAGAVLGLGAFTVSADAEQQVAPESGRAGVTIDRRAVETVARAAVMRADVHACGVHRIGTVTVVRHGAESVGFTNAHVVQGTNEVELSGDPGGDRAEVSGAVDHRDAAVVGLDAAAKAGGLPAGVRPLVGDRVLVAGYPGGRYHQEWGSVRGFDERMGRGGLTTVMLIDVEAEGGMSGGAVLDESGAAAGLVAARDPDTGWVVAYPLGELLGRPQQPSPGC